MSQYLRLLILGEPDDLTRDCYPHSSIELGQNYGVMGQIIDLSWMRKSSPARLDIPAAPRVATHPLPPDVKVHIHTARGTKMTRRDDLSEELTWAAAEDLLAIEVPGPDDAEGDWPTNIRCRAAKAYLAALPGNTPIVLYRH